LLQMLRTHCTSGSFWVTGLLRCFSGRSSFLFYI
jgi:hypothetical protein